jgi:hypothetical protein
MEKSFLINQNKDRKLRVFGKKNVGGITSRTKETVEIFILDSESDGELIFR